MRRTLPMILSTMALSTFALAGCGGSGATSVKLATRVAFKSPAIAAHAMPALYTCDGRDIHPPLEWGAVPSGARELMLLVVGLEPTGTGYFSSSVRWALAGVSPGLHRLAAGETPPGAKLGLASEGEVARYSVCPKKGVREQYEFMLFAVPTAIKVRPDFPAIAALGGLSQEGTRDSAIAKGTFVASYKRR